MTKQSPPGVTSMKKRRLLSVVIAFVTGVVTGSLSTLLCTIPADPTIDVSKYNDITSFMKAKDVEQLLGRPPGDYRRDRERLPPVEHDESRVRCDNGDEVLVKYRA